MDERKFWQLIDAARVDDGDDENANRLIAALNSLAPGDILGFARKFHELRAKAYLGDLWAAAVLLNGGTCGDDGFEYFRNWLISLGREAYIGALRNPDSLADKRVADQSLPPSARDEQYGYAAAEAYELQTGEDVYQAMASRGMILPDESTGDWDWQDYTQELIAARLPRLWARYGDCYLARQIRRARREAEREGMDEFFVQGVGLLTRDGVIYHRNRGKGIVEYLKGYQKGDRASVKVRFERDSYPELWFDYSPGMVVEKDGDMWSLDEPDSKSTDAQGN